MILLNITIENLSTNFALPFDKPLNFMIHFPINFVRDDSVLFPDSHDFGK